MTNVRVSLLLSMYEVCVLVLLYFSFAALSVTFSYQVVAMERMSKQFIYSLHLCLFFLTLEDLHKDLSVFIYTSVLPHKVVFFFLLYEVLRRFKFCITSPDCHSTNTSIVGDIRPLNKKEQKCTLNLSLYFIAVNHKNKSMPTQKDVHICLKKCFQVSTFIYSSIMSIIVFFPPGKVFFPANVLYLSVLQYIHTSWSFLSMITHRGHLACILALSLSKFPLPSNTATHLNQTQIGSDGIQ